MKLNEITRPIGITDGKKIVGRGAGSGKGKQSGYGRKGAKARSGRSKRVGFEGGQTPLYRRLPKKKGFRPHVRIVYVAVNVGALEGYEGEQPLDLNALYNAPVKLLGSGELTTKVSVRASAFSASAREKVEKAGGTCEVV
ncbi:MAG: 50S ribosomal protein L15 [Caldisericota bacterium]|jgi:large subunit ribosomal protein L15|nr:50S ribosomal protein L15 [Caldisericota bacterium]